MLLAVYACSGILCFIGYVFIGITHRRRLEEYGEFEAAHRSDGKNSACGDAD